MVDSSAIKASHTSSTRAGSRTRPAVCPNFAPASARLRDSSFKWNPAAVETAGTSPISPVIALEASADQLSVVVDSGEVAPGSALFIWN
ncbi:hypothetical protein SAMN05216483_6235 [Streptomyces sp. 2131.1]|nr:hypothetical protein SAMN05216483_6235 [Streptomyces sp. 2131.1]